MTDPVRAALVQMVEAAEACTTGKPDGPVRFYKAKAAGRAALAAEPVQETWRCAIEEAGRSGAKRCKDQCPACRSVMWSE